MESNKPEAIRNNRIYVPTAEYAEEQLVKPQTIRKRLSQTGSYFGTRPIKLKNGRLAWPSARGE